MIRHLGAASAAVLALAAFAPAHAAVSFGSASAVSNASADTNYAADSYGHGFGTKTKTVTSYQPTVSATAGAQADSYDDNGFVSSSADALEQSNAVFATPASGYLDESGITSATTTAADTADAYSEGQSTQYTFTVDTASTINLGYALNESYADPYASTQLYLGAANFSSQLFNNDLTLNTSGSLSFNLTPGTYLLALNTQEGDYASAASGTSSFGSHEENVDFNISAAPEPAAWALMMVGVGFVGAALRRRKAPSVVVA